MVNQVKRKKKYENVLKLDVWLFLVICGGWYNCLYIVMIMFRFK